jgi:hypothetical protein
MNSMTSSNGHFECARCGKDLGNGSLGGCVVVSRLNFTSGLVENLHLCITVERKEDGTVKEVSGCGHSVIDPELGAWYKKVRAAEREQRSANRANGSGSKRAAERDSGDARGKASRRKGDGSAGAQKASGGKRATSKGA